MTGGISYADPKEILCPWCDCTSRGGGRRDDAGDGGESIKGGGGGARAGRLLLPDAPHLYQRPARGLPHMQHETGEERRLRGYESSKAGGSTTPGYLRHA